MRLYSSFKVLFLICSQISALRMDKSEYDNFLSFLSQAAPLTEHRLVATWSERGVVSIWDVSKHMILLDSPTLSGGAAAGKNLTGHKETPLFTFSGHLVRIVMCVTHI